MAEPNCDLAKEFFWRRLLAGTALAALGALGWSALNRLDASSLTSPASMVTCAPAERACAAPAARHSLVTYIVRPGDTVWAIAVRYSHGKDPRPLEYELEAQVGGATLQPGEALRVP